MPIKNIIFDLGGVIINLDYNKTCEAFHKLNALNFAEFYSFHKQESFFDDFEIGKISPSEFRQIVQAKLNITVSEVEFDTAWNAMLLDIPRTRLEFIKQLRNEYRIFLFSNTNAIHLREIVDVRLKEKNLESFDKYFEKQYFSNIFGKRKPHAESFTAIIDENKISAAETLFIDDSLQHVLGAKDAGLNAVHLANGKSVLDTLSFIEEINSVILSA